ncbi:thiamine phosphate synthase [Sphingobium sp. LB126]|uniref:thiamine phosphate synthase n=1 Tax=Sphingobium sp. LB126 TaxID=1983755 RepID=UPI000C20CCA5|nr:thiamine phosphate synthase [Sphingobium sp. LB126]PJG48093.1 thiamine phosphate synthase [Sphingobium sp. LB126]
MKARHRKKLPTIWLMTDERVGEEALLAAARRLPKGRAGIVLRHYGTDGVGRRALFDRLASIARRRRLTLMLGGTAAEAAALRADGWHGRDRRRSPRPLLRSMPVHDRRELQAALQGGADFIFVSPLFPTRSHPGKKWLGQAGFAALARLSPVPVMALGGVRATHRQMLKGIGAFGWAAIDGLSIESR